MNADGALKALVFGGAKRDRTADPLLAKQVLSQLSYSPMRFGTAKTLICLPHSLRHQRQVHYRR